MLHVFSSVSFKTLKRIFLVQSILILYLHICYLFKFPSGQVCIKHIPLDFVCHIIYVLWASLVAHMVKNLPEICEIWVLYLIWEDPLEKEIAIHSSILAWRIPWTEEPGGLQSIGS